MPPRTNAGSTKLGASIRAQRIALGLTIEEAALKAGVGTKTWCRYESGSSIRSDKVLGVCKALGWLGLPDNEKGEKKETASYLDTIDESDEVWPAWLNELYGRKAAVSFVVGSDLLLDYLKEDLLALSSKPRGTHIGELGASWLDGDLPEQFKTRYDYEFVFALLCVVEKYRKQARFAQGFTAHTVLDELALYLIVEESRICLAEWCPDGSDEEDRWDEWASDVRDDEDLEWALFSDQFVSPGDVYHFDNWLTPQFYLS